MQQNNLLIYQTEDGALALKGDCSQETIWASQKQIAQIFNVTSQNITMHLKNIFSSQELEEQATCKEFLQVQQEGKRSIKRKINITILVLVMVYLKIKSLTNEMEE